MNAQTAQELLQRYFDGTTSLDEERKLQRYFAEGNLPDSLKAYQPMFAGFAEERAVAPPTHRHEVRRFRLSWSVITGIAASVALILLVGFPKTQDDYIYYVDGQRIYDKATAMAAAERKLQMLATSMQTARSSMAAFEVVQESRQPLQQLNQALSTYQRLEERMKFLE